MVLTLTPKQLEFVRLKVESGSYANATEVVEEALSLLDDRDRLARLRSMLDEADAQFERGDYDEWTPELKLKIAREGDEMYRLGIAPDPDVCP